MIKTHNPYIEEKRRLQLEIEREPKNYKLQEDLARLEVQESLYLQDIIRKATSSIEAVQEKFTELNVEKPKPLRLYKSLVELHRTSKSLTEQIKKYKYEALESVKEKRNKK